MKSPGSKTPGGGNFLSPKFIQYGWGGDPCGAAADFDNDGDIDLITGAWVGLQRNQGNGEFGPFEPIDTGNQLVMDLDDVDLDGDGDLDLVTGSEDGRVLWYANDGAGSFSSPQLIHEDIDQIEDIEVADVDGDGDLDIAIIRDEAPPLYVSLNDGSQSFGALIELESSLARGERLEATDLNGDGHADLLATSQIYDKLTLHMADGAGGFDSEVLVETEIDGPRGIAVFDEDNDGDLDVFMGAGSGSSSSPLLLNLYRNDGTGTLAPAEQIASGFRMFDMVQGDFDGDGFKEYLVGAEDLHILTKNEDGVYVPFSFEYLEGLGTGQTHSWAYEVFAEDLDGDGDLDPTAIGQCIAWYKNRVGEGCLDEAACNYCAECWISSDCCYDLCGCTLSGAANYDDDALCDDGSCEWRVTAHVFNDVNGNGSQYGTDEVDLSNYPIQVEPTGMTVWTDDDGDVSFNTTEPFLTLTAEPNELFPYSTTPNPVSFQPSPSSDDFPAGFTFGLAFEEPGFAVCVDFYPNGNGWLCDTLAVHNICFRNMGNVPIDGVVEVEYDELFQFHEEITPIDSTDGNSVYMSFENLEPGEMFFYDLGLQTPTVDFIGEEVESVARVWGFYQDEQVAYGESVRIQEVTCAYDPNDKQAFPLGYGDDHLLLNENQQEFVVRFQNTGNALAYDITIRDTLDVNFDLSTFEMVANSHSVVTSIDTTSREVVFFFDNIYLPDSVSNEPESHGMISYRVSPLPGLEAGTVLNNTAYIYFDNNPPIVTNTTWTTIHECSGALEFDYALQPACPLWLPAVNSTYEEVTGLPSDHYWTADGDLSSQTGELQLPLYYQGNIQLTISNPLCVETGNVDWEPVLDLQWFTCPGDLDCDYYIDAVDLLAILSNYGCEVPECTFELTGDGEVTSDDLLMILGAFGVQCE